MVAKKNAPPGAASIGKRTTPSGRKVVSVDSPGKSRTIGVTNKQGKFVGTAGQDWRSKNANARRAK